MNQFTAAKLSKTVLVCAVTFRTVTSYTNDFLLLALVVSLTTASFYGWFPLYLPELFPTRVRATGQVLSYNFGRIFAALGALTQGRNSWRRLVEVTRKPERW